MKAPVFLCPKISHEHGYPVRFLLQKINAKPNFFHQIPLIDAIIVLASDIFCLNYQNSHKKRKRTHGSDTEFFC